MTILPTKRSGNNNVDEAKDNATQNVNKDRPVRHRDDHNISHNVSSLSDANTSVCRRQFAFSGASAERKDRTLRKRFKIQEPSVDRTREWERERKRERKSKHVITVEQNLENGASTSESTSEPAGNNLEKDASTSEEGTGYNSEDEYDAPKQLIKGRKLTDEEWETRESYFARCLKKLGFEIKAMTEDGACLFRAIADQVYGDQELHQTVRSQCMDYIVKNKDYFAPYVTEDFDKYVARKQRWNVHGNHLEIQALSEMYNRTIEVYCYHTEPINIFNRSRLSAYEPIRVSYHRMCHYNSITNPNKPSVLVGLGLPNYVTRFDLDRRQIHDAVLQSEELLIEQTMLEDKIKATDWEATNEALEEQIARESYIQFYRDAERRLKTESHSHGGAGSSSTITSATCSSPRLSRRGSVSPKGSMSPKGGSSPKSCQASSQRVSATTLSSFAADTGLASTFEGEQMIASQDDMHFGGSQPASVYVPYPSNCNINLESIPSGSSAATQSRSPKPSSSSDLKASEDYEAWDEGILAQVLAESQQYYFADLKRKANKCYGSPGPSTSG